MKILWIFKFTILNKDNLKMANQGISMPSMGGGLIRYNEEYKSRFMLKPAHVVLFIILILIFVIGLKIFFPIK